MSRDEVDQARKEFCALCPVRRDCLLFSLLAQERWGVWGGLSHTERARALELKGGSVEKVMRADRSGRLLKLVLLP